MKKFVPIILGLVLFTNSCNIFDSILPPYYLSQQYYISASRDKTSVEATAFFQRLGKFKNTKPISKLEFNGTEMKKESLKAEPDYSPSCETYEKEENNDSAGIFSLKTPEPTPTSEIEKYKFFTVSNGYQNENKFVITDESNKTYPVTIYFEPVEPQNPGKIILSRSKDTTIQLKGKGSGKQEDVKFFVSQRSGGSFDEKVAPYNSDNNRLVIPASLTKRLAKGGARFLLYSEYSGFLDPQKSWAGFFSITFRTEVCAEIVD